MQQPHSEGCAIVFEITRPFRRLRTATETW